MTPAWVVILLLLLSALFSSSELAIMGTPLYKIKQAVQHSKSKISKMLLHLRKNPERTLITILIGNNLVNVALSIYASNLWDTILKSVAISWAIGFMMVSVGITFLILFFGEIIPKVFATKFSLKLGLFFAPIINGIYYLLFPVVYLLEKFIKLLNKIIKSNEDRVCRDDVEIFVDEGKKQWIFSNQESMIIKNLLDFNSRRIEAVLRHRTDMFAVWWDTKLGEAIKQILNKPYSRIPVYLNDKDNIIWLVMLKDLLKFAQTTTNLQKPLKDFRLRKIFKIPITANIFDVFLKMKKLGQHFALVVDEYWGTEWIVTFEDILEEMVWDIRDEYDLEEEQEIQKIWTYEAIAKWDVSLREVLNVFNVEEFQIPKDLNEKIDEDDMISYIVLIMLKHFAKKGEKVNIWKLEIRVAEIEPDQNKILKVNLKYSPNNGKD